MPSGHYVFSQVMARFDTKYTQPPLRAMLSRQSLQQIVYMSQTVPLKDLCPD